MEKIYHSYPRLSYCSKYKGFCEQEDGSLLLNNQEGCLISNTIYADQKDTIWQYLKINADSIWDIEVYVWISNDERLLERFDTYDLDTAIEWLQENYVIKSDDNGCFLFNEDKIKGKFMKFVLLMHLPFDTQSILYGYDVFFPLESFIKYLPACFANNEKRIKLFDEYQILYELLEEEIEMNQYEMDVEACQSKHLNMLAEWLAADEIYYIQDNDKKRKLLANYISINCKKGTMYYYKQLVKYVCDDKLHLILDRENNILHIYGYMNNYNECQKREQLFKDRVPLYITCYFHWNVSAKMNEHIYIGINSVLSSHSEQYEINDFYL